MYEEIEEEPKIKTNNQSNNNNNKKKDVSNDIDYYEDIEEVPKK